MTTIFNFYLFISIILNDGQILDGQDSVKYFFFKFFVCFHFDLLINFGL